MNWSNSWLVQHWYLPFLLFLAFMFALGVFLNWRREKRRGILSEVEFGTRLAMVLDLVKRPRTQSPTLQPPL